ncbi:hypothetical protein [Bradyrhizobium sp. CCBAU 53421]|uniref:hypothetical protein n=1 Tax=Bradyrhizobium sp. CCBAU 53421 TaxID=1325120 RepID=UPI001889EA51|nr:hypothetical protein [Bradyrhizobium sp. CCBAU 53421]QOZ37462.1 hypothetical protein XH92_42810 [Bradyrhizobium sp. CCBAU 53421]
MKLALMTDETIGLVVTLPNGPQIIDIARSAGVFVPHDPLSSGLLNGAFKDGADWPSILKHWERLQWPLRRLALIAESCPDHPSLVVQSLADRQLKGESAIPIVAIDITDMQPLDERDPTGWRAMKRQFVTPSQEAVEADPTATAETAQVIGFARPNKDESSKR